MFGKLSKKHIKGVFWALAILIVPSFILWGSSFSMREERTRAYAGVIFGKKITQQQYNNSLTALKHIFILNGASKKEQPDPYTINKLTWDRIILLAEAKKRNINVSDKEVVNAILKMPFFIVRGKFDNAIYKEILQATFYITERQFEEEIRQALIIEKLYREESSKVKLSPNDIADKYKEKNELLSLNYIAVNFKDFEIGEINKEEINKYYAEHSQDFKNKTRANIQYLGLAFPPNSKLSEKESLKKKIDAIAKNITDTTDLEKTAQETKLELKETGPVIVDEKYLSELNNASQIAAISLFLPLGKTTPPLEINNGYYILRVKEKIDNYMPTLEESNMAIKQMILDEKQGALALKEAQNIYDKLIKLKKEKPDFTFEQIANSLKLKVSSTELFNRETKKFEKIGPAPNLTKQAFTLSDGQIKEPLEINKCFYIFTRNKFVGIDKEKFEKEKAAFSKTAVEEAKAKSELDLLEKLRQDSRLINYVGNNPS